MQQYATDFRRPGGGRAEPDAARGRAAAMEAAGIGARIDVEDLDRAARATHVLVAGAPTDFDAGEVSAASPMGRALLGAAPGDVVTVETPQRTRRLRVLAVRAAAQDSSVVPTTD